MNLFSHHAYRLYGDPHTSREYIAQLLIESNTEHAPIDIVIIEESADLLSVDTVRTLHKRLQTRVMPNEKRIVILSFSHGTHEAQNALLKVCEEPGENTILFFVTPSEYALLPTLRSRTQHIVVNASHVETSSDISLFASSPYAERFKMVETLIEEKNKGDLVRYVNALEEYTMQQKPSAEKTSFLHTLEMVRTYVLEKGCSPKLLLDICAVYMPRTQK